MKKHHLIFLTLLLSTLTFSSAFAKENNGVNMRCKKCITVDGDIVCKTRGDAERCLKKNKALREAYYHNGTGACNITEEVNNTFWLKDAMVSCPSVDAAED